MVTKHSFVSALLIMTFASNALLAPHTVLRAAISTSTDEVSEVDEVETLTEEGAEPTPEKTEKDVEEKKENDEIDSESSNAEDEATKEDKEAQDAVASTSVHEVTVSTTSEDSVAETEIPPVEGAENVSSSPTSSKSTSTTETGSPDDAVASTTTDPVTKKATTSEDQQASSTTAERATTTESDTGNSTESSGASATTSAPSGHERESSSGDGDIGAAKPEPTATTAAATGTSKLATTDSSTDSSSEIAASEDDGLTGASVTATKVGKAAADTEDSASSTEVAANSATSSPASTTSIVTGNAVATANLINLLNTNFVNSDGSVVFLDLYDNHSETIDLRNALSTTPLTACSLSKCDLAGATLRFVNDATIDNALWLTAYTGGNTIEGADGAVIETGDAYANANIINLANTNIVDSKYFLLTLNAFADLDGDIVFPSLQSYLRQAGVIAGAQTSLFNSAHVENDVSLTADTGNNAAESVGTSSIATGQAKTLASIYNQINTSLIGGENVSVLFRVHGSWMGDVFGLPDNATWTKTPFGYILNVQSEYAATDAAGETASVAATNTARIKNKVNVLAGTGDNTISDASTALISTGDAFAGANIVNVVNANVIGRNWMLAIVNIFGDFTGDVAFGRPDLWIGGIVDRTESPRNGEQITYTYTIRNNGDSPANGVVVRDAYSEYIRPVAGDYEINTSARSVSWNLGRLNPGETVEVSYHAIIVGTDDETEISNISSLSLTETDHDTSDNTELISFTTAEVRSSGGSVTRNTSRNSGGGTDTRDASDEDLTPAALEVTRLPVSLELSPQERTTVQVLTIRNDSNETIPNVVLKDLLDGPGNELVREETWQLGDVLPNEELMITYTMSFSANTPTGTYSFSTVMENQFGEFVAERNGVIRFVHPLQTLPIFAQGDPISVVNEGEIELSSATQFASTTFEGVVKGTSTDSGVVAQMAGGNPLIPMAAASEGEMQPVGPYQTLAWIVKMVLPFMALYLLYYLLSLYAKPQLNRAKNIAKHSFPTF